MAFRHKLLRRNFIFIPLHSPLTDFSEITAM